MRWVDRGCTDTLASAQATVRNRAQATGHFQVTDEGDVISLDGAGVTATVQRLFPDEHATKA